MHVFQSHERPIDDSESCTRSPAKLQAVDGQTCLQGRFNPGAFAGASLVHLTPSSVGGCIVKHLVEEQLLAKEPASVLSCARSSHREALNEYPIKADFYQIRPSRLAA